VTDLTKIQFEPLMGSTNETKILDLIIPLKDGTMFTPKDVVKALGSTAKQINPLLKKMEKDGILVQVGKKECIYILNPKSNRVWAVRNLLISIYQDLAHQHSLERMGRRL
jgi:predicted transcriptional regulator